ncbi:MAG: hypothetical protein QXH27_01690 [Candidatus Micrarchaeia archaeon]
MILLAVVASVEAMEEFGLVSGPYAHLAFDLALTGAVLAFSAAAWKFHKAFVKEKRMLL